MTTVDFYLLKQTNNARNNFACRLIQKAYARGHRIFIQANNEKQAIQLDELLWTFRDISFIPHNMIGEGPHQTPPVQIGYGETIPKNFRDILINLADNIPSFCQQFNRILEIVPEDPETKTTLREHFRYYQQQGYQLNTHQITD